MKKKIAKKKWAHSRDVTFLGHVGRGDNFCCRWSAICDITHFGPWIPTSSRIVPKLPFNFTNPIFVSKEKPQPLKSSCASGIDWVVRCLMNKVAQDERLDLECAISAVAVADCVESDTNRTTFQSAIHPGPPIPLSASNHYTFCNTYVNSLKITSILMQFRGYLFVPECLDRIETSRKICRD